MAKESRVGIVLDDDEKELYEAIEADNYEPGENHLTPELKKELQESARATINDERTRVTLRLSKSLLARIKAEAVKEGMPYQTFIGSILHKAVT